MSQQNSGQMIQPGNALRLKVGGGRLGAIDPAAIAKAEAALKSLSSNFAQWLADEITKLEAAAPAGPRRQGITAERHGEPLSPRPRPEGPRHHLWLSADHPHRRLALPDDRRQGKRAATPMELVDAHIDAICAAVRDDIKSDEHPDRQRAGRRARAPRRRRWPPRTPLPIRDCSRRLERSALGGGSCCSAVSAASAERRPIRRHESMNSPTGGPRSGSPAAVDRGVQAVLRRNEDLAAAMDGLAEADWAGMVLRSMIAAAVDHRGHRALRRETPSSATMWPPP